MAINSETDRRTYMNPFTGTRQILVLTALLCFIGWSTTSIPADESRIPDGDTISVDVSVVESIQPVVIKLALTGGASPTPTIRSVTAHDGSVLVKVSVHYVTSVDLRLRDKDVYLIDAEGAIRHGSVLSNRALLTQLTPPAYVPVSMVNNTYSFRRGSTITYDVFFEVPECNLKESRLVFAGREFLVET